MSKKSHKAKPLKVQVGNHMFTWGKGLSEMEDSTHLFVKQDFDGLRYKLETEGYIFVRGVISKDKALRARDAMLKQAAKDGSVLNTKDTPYSLGRMAKHQDNKTWHEGYCLDGMTGTETNERENIDIDAWMKLGPSKTMQDVYLGEDLRLFWNNLFGNGTVSDLAMQTFLRLMGDSATQEHADYYYFKKDTHIFSGFDGRQAIDALKNYKIKHNLPLHTLDPNIAKNLQIIEKNNNIKNTNNDNEKNILFCNICEKYYLKQSLDQVRLKRLEKGGFGVSGEWHCPQCAIQCFGLYTTWCSLSNLEFPKDSILAMCPKSHLLTQWDVPKPKDKQLCNDFNWKMPWVIPVACEPGDIVLFNIKTVHASSLNLTVPRTFRVSCDTRIALTHYKKQNEIKNNSNNTNNNNLIFGENRKYNSSPHPPLSVVKRKNGKNAIKNAKRSIKNPNFESDENSENENNSLENESNECNEECKSEIDSENNENLEPQMMTRAQTKRMKEMKKHNQLKQISKRNDESSTDALTSSMSDLKLIA